MTEPAAEDDSGETVQLLCFLVGRWEGEIVSRNEHSEVMWSCLKRIETLAYGWAEKGVVEKPLMKAL